MSEEKNELILAQDKAQDKAQDEIVSEKISNMNEEEKQAIEYWKTHMEILHCNTQIASEHYIKVLLDLVKKQHKEIEKRLKEIDSLYKMMSAKDERIDNLMEMINSYNDMAYIRKIEELYISKDKIRHIRDKAECMDYYSLNDVIDDLSKLLGETND